jgi:ABC-type multidrug transport system ATPase subunit
MEHYTILHDLSGVFAPGRITLMLGPPGGGKSMLMKALCGLAPAAITGDITYNGHTQDEFNVRRTCRYVMQSDLHNSALTVRETLTFSAMCQGPGYHRSVTLLSFALHCNMQMSARQPAFALPTAVPITLCHPAESTVSTLTICS